MRSAAVIIASTRAAAGTYQDECAPLITAWLAERGYQAAGTDVVADGDPFRQALAERLAEGHAAVITSGGTGLSPDDLTPEITAEFLERHLPGIMEAMREAGRAKTPMASLSRGYAGTSGTSFVINLPGSPSGVGDGLDVLAPLLDHVCAQLEGRDAHI
ncbi:molybdopterin-binding protein [Arthrobacter castelli]|uniref:molybdopterin-binding protein n=1 Tax=Arthrobacter castelli TaxID=271431 RepID=UPI000407666D|nr:molybdopterin-binding protein [Arthrobacter castelli]